MTHRYEVYCSQRYDDIRDEVIKESSLCMKNRSVQIQIRLRIGWFTYDGYCSQRYNDVKETDTV